MGHVITTTLLSGTVCRHSVRTSCNQSACKIWSVFVHPLWGYERRWKMQKFGWFGGLGVTMSNAVFVLGSFYCLALQFTVLDCWLCLRLHYLRLHLLPCDQDVSPWLQCTYFFISTSMYGHMLKNALADPVHYRVHICSQINTLKLLHHSYIK